VAAARIVEALDEREDRAARLGPRLEPAVREHLAFERGEEALAHGVANDNDADAEQAAA
jgi:hypothetical protein